MKNITSQNKLNRTGARVISPSSGVRPGARAFTFELPTSFGFRIFVGALCLLAGSFLFSNVFFSHSVYAAFSASISRSGTVSLAEPGSSTIRPTSTGTLGTGSDTVSVTTNCTYGGYKLYVSATSSGGTNLNRSGASASELADASNYITASSTAVGSETALSRDTWGVGKTASAFSGLPAYNSDVGTLTPFYSGTSSDSYEFYYGINVSTAKTPGTYTGEVLYTVLMDEACVKYTLNFDGNSATTNTLAPQDLDFDSTINLAEISSSDKISRTDYTLTGWKDQAGNHYGITGEADTNPSDLSSVTLTAQWEISSHAVTINKGSNVAAVSGANTYTYGSKVTISATAFSTGYHFSGWTVDSDSVILYSDEAMTTASTTSTPAYFTMPDNDVTITANATANTLTITYSANGGTGTASKTSETAYYGTNVTMPTQNTLAKSGYDFLGWSLSSTATSATWAAGQTNIDPTAINSNLSSSSGLSTTVYAVWKQTVDTTTMQGWIANGSCASLASNRTVTLKDSRDGNSYVIKKLKDNKCWMVQNLKLVGPRTLTSSDSNVTSNFTLTASTGNSGWCMKDDSACDDKSMVYYDSSKSTTTTDASYYGALYNWYTATAGTGKYATSSGSATSSICPKGWHLPKGGTDKTVNEFSVLDVAWGGTGTSRSSANTYSTFTGAYTSGNSGSFGLAGYISGSMDYVGSNGYYWSSTASSYLFAYYLFLRSDNTSVGLQTNYSKYSGYSVRCVASS